MPERVVRHGLRLLRRNGWEGLDSELSSGGIESGLLAAVTLSMLRHFPMPMYTTARMESTGQLFPVELHSASGISSDWLFSTINWWSSAASALWAAERSQATVGSLPMGTPGLRLLELRCPMAGGLATGWA